MYFQTGADLISSLNLASVDTLEQAGDRAVAQAVHHLEKDLRTPLSEAIYSDIWVLNASDVALGQLILKLKAGFVDYTTLRIGTGPNVTDAKANSSLTADALVDYEKGLVTLFGADLNRVVSVRYEAGIPADDSNSDLFDDTVAPDWMVEAARVKAAQVLASDSDVENSKGKVLDAMSLKEQYASLITERVRYSPMARTPTA